MTSFNKSLSLTTRFRPRQCIELLSVITQPQGNKGGNGNIQDETFDPLHRYCLTVDSIWQEIRAQGFSEHEFDISRNSLNPSEKPVLACGPYVSFKNGYDPLQKYLARTTDPVVADIIFGSASYVYILILFFILMYIMRF